jgi:hypothetical protein
MGFICKEFLEKPKDNPNKSKNNPSATGRRDALYPR